MGLAYWLHLNGRVLFVVFELIGAAFILCACDVVHWVKKTWVSLNLRRQTLAFPYIFVTGLVLFSVFNRCLDNIWTFSSKLSSFLRIHFYSVVLRLPHFKKFSRIWSF